MGLFGAAHRLGGGGKPPPPLIFVTHPTMMKLSTAIPYLEQTQEIY